LIHFYKRDQNTELAFETGRQGRVSGC